MKNVLIASLALIAVSAAAQDLPRPSPKATLTQTVGLTDVSVAYNRPSVRGRAIWGALVPYGQVWRTGANEATIVRFSDDVTIDGQKLAAGAYSLHTIPAASEWTIIFNTVANATGGYSYDAAKDSLRIKAKPRSAEHAEMFTVSMPRVGSDSADVVLHWEKVAVPFTIKVDTHAKALANIEKALTEMAADDWRTAYRAADYLHQNGGDAMTVLNRSTAVQEKATNMSLKARILAKSGDRAAAIAAAEKAIRLGKAATPPSDTTAIAKELAEWKAQK